MGRSRKLQEEQMLSLVEDWRSSGLTKQAFSQGHGISYKRFLYWTRKYAAIGGLSPSVSSQDVFKELKITPATTMATPSVRDHPVICMTLELDNGRRLLFYQQPGIDFIKALID